MLAANTKRETSAPEPSSAKASSCSPQANAGLPPTTVQQIMTTTVVSVSPDQKFEELAHLIVSHPMHHFPVLEDDRSVAGIVSERDILLLMAKKKTLQGMTVGELMTRAVVTVQPETPLSEAASKMLERRLHCLPVVDSNGKLCGIVTSTDLLKAFQRLQASLERAAGGPSGSARHRA
jgi:CBS-domain-containing membrane protein